MKKKYIFIGIGIIFIGIVGFLLFMKTLFLGKHLSFSESANALLPECNVKSVEKIRKGMYPKWSHTKNLIAFNDWGNSGTADIYTMRPDGSDLKCLTCDNKPKDIAGVFRHAGQPFWHPNGEYIVFTAENNHSKPTRYNADKMPGFGHNHDIWIMTSDGKKYWRLTNYPPGWGVIRPSFSHDGRMIYWNEEYSCERTTCPKPDPEGGCCAYWSLAENPKGEEWGRFRIKYADIDFGPDGPSISNIRTVSPNDIYPNLKFIEGSGFTPDDKHFIWEAADVNNTLRNTMFWGDLYVCDLKGGSLKRLTEKRTPTLFVGNENEEYSPDGTKIAWSRSNSIITGCNNEIYLMNANGSNKARLTYFNKLKHPHHDFGYTCSCGELDWSPDGKRIIFGYKTSRLPVSRFAWPPSNQDLYMLTFEGACGRM